MKYRIPVYRVATNHGFAEIEAESPSDAMAKFRAGEPAEVEWDDTHDIDWWSSDIEIPEGVEAMSPERFAWWQSQWEVDGAAGEIVAQVLGFAEADPETWTRNLDALRFQVEAHRTAGNLMHLGIYEEALQYLESRPE